MCLEDLTRALVKSNDLRNIWDLPRLTIILFPFGSDQVEFPSNEGLQIEKVRPVE